MIIQIDYDQNKTGHNYRGLISKAKPFEKRQIQPCKSCWSLVKVDEVCDA